MFYYRITTKKRIKHRGGKTTTTRRVRYHEFLKPQHLGEHVASLTVGSPNRITIERVPQAVYKRGLEETA
jgi:hypothetical protein